MKYIIALILITTYSYSWEINTHRAIDRKAIELSANLKKFVKNSEITTSSHYYNGEQFYGYNRTYLSYIENGENNGISISKWKQVFISANLPSYQKMIEAGSILEDAQWQHFLDGGQYNYWDKAHGRFVNHFYDAQNAGHALTYGAFLRTDALNWGLGGRIYTGSFEGYPTYVKSANIYTYKDTLDYFLKAFTETNPTVRKKYQAKMLVGVGHLLHLMNDMTSPAHTRDDSHPLGDAMEVCGRGGESGKEHRGFRIEGNSIQDYLGILKFDKSIDLPNIPKYSKFSDFISQESYWVSTHFFSNDTIFTKPRPSVSDTYEFTDSVDDGVTQYYIKSYGTGNVGCNNGCVPVGTKLAIGIKSWILDKLEIYYPDRVLGKTTTFKGDYSVLKENAKVLIPRAIANARNFLDYFFRGQIEAKIDGRNITIKNISKPSLVKDGNTATLQYGGYFSFKYTTSNDDTLHDFGFKRDQNRVIPNIESIGEGGPFGTRIGFTSLVSLAPGESMTVAIEKDTGILGKNIVVIYDGIIGDERGLAVCAAQTPSAMRN